jgi:hypothetical protein
MAGLGGAVYWAAASKPQLIGKPLPSAPFATSSSFKFEVVTVNDTGQVVGREMLF